MECTEIILIFARVQREQKMLKGHLPRVTYHQVYQYTKIEVINTLWCSLFSEKWWRGGHGRWGVRTGRAHPAPYTLHPTPNTLHPTPYTLHPTPYTMHPALYGEGTDGGGVELAARGAGGRTRSSAPPPSAPSPPPLLSDEGTPHNFNAFRLKFNTRVWL